MSASDDGYDHGPKGDHHHPAPLTDVEVRVRALEELLREKGLVDESFIDAVVSAYENDIGPMNGARVVACAWVDPAYRRRLLADATAAIGELGYAGPEGDHMVVVENTEAVHNVVVCTLCSSYPWPVLGLPPSWYKSAAYRSRLVREPRVVLREMGLDLPESIEIRIARQPFGSQTGRHTFECPADFDGIPNVIQSESSNNESTRWIRFEQTFMRQPFHGEPDGRAGYAEHRHKR